MFSKFITLGDKIELQSTDQGMDDQTASAGKVYMSEVYDILSEDVIEIQMPMEKTKVILLPVDVEFDMVFYTSNGMYQCFGRIVDRYKSNNMYLLRVELTSNLRKYQRREFYRLRCAIEMHSRNLREKEIQTIESNLPYTLDKGLPLKECVIVDISGGGLRFLSNHCYEAGSMLYCCYHLINGAERKKYEVISRVLSAVELENRKGTYEHRVKFYDIDPAVQEEIIKFIFEEERRSRQKEKYGRRE